MCRVYAGEISLVFKIAMNIVANPRLDLDLTSSLARASI